MLRQKFPNLARYLNEATEAYRGGFVSDDGNRLSYKMPVITFGHHVGDNWVTLERGFSGYILSVESKIDSHLKVKTSSSREVSEDLSTEQWKQNFDEVLIAHSIKPEYGEFAKGKVGKEFEKKISGQGSGCMVFIIGGIAISVLAYLMI